ncbi:MAG: DUF2779 domain-containing protein [Bacteroidales bacterium]|nr:DUF2779 domain-containing protein [Bacteroidales bacterium]
MAYLTKSRFRLALECPVKLFYTGKEEYPDQKQQNEFLEALAEGGFQVGALAKLYYPGGIEVADRGYDIPLERTNQLLGRNDVVIFEAAFKYEKLFIRADIIIKRGNHIDLIEVKSKSFRGDDDTTFMGKRGGLVSGWEPYLYDVAFQKYVIRKAFPGFTVKAHLMLADKDKKATVDGLNQKFFINRDEKGHVFIETEGDTTAEALGEKVLTLADVDDIADGIIEGRFGELEPGMDFATAVDFYADHYDRNIMIDKRIGAQCAKCEFNCQFEDEVKGLHSGFRTCWTKSLQWTREDFNKPHVFDIWDNRRKGVMMDAGKYHMSQLTMSDIGDFKPSRDGRLTRNERQWLQVEKTIANDKTPHLDASGLREEMDKLKYPLHFIDFETSMVAIPFNRGRKPYEGIAFQFSHHIVERDGTVRHAGEYLNAEPGVFPNFEFLRRLKAGLEQDEGTIFRYADHENTFLVKIWTQLNEMTDAEVENRQELMDFIKTITHSTENCTEQWTGERNMVDMLELVKRYFWYIDMKGSNSIKVVLPSVLKISDFIRDKYSLPVYGAEGGILSSNFRNKQWYVTDDSGNVVNPYKLLDPVFSDIDQDTLDSVIVDESIADGGAAMTAYARMQFTRMTSVERELAAAALKRYCELDTLAMVMIYEYWKSMTR